MARRRINGFDTSKIPWNFVIIVGGLILFKKELVDPILSLFGASPEDKAQHDAQQAKQLQYRQQLDQASSMNAWNPNWYYDTEGGKYSQFHSIGPTIEAHIPILHDQIYSWDDEFPAILAFFKTMLYQTQISKIAALYLSKYGNDLLADMRSKIDDNKLIQVTDYVSKLPSGKF